MNHSKKPILLLLSFVAGAGAGFLLGKKTSEPGTRAEMLGRWQELKDTVLAKMRSVRGLTEAKYYSIVDRAVEEYVHTRGLAEHEAEHLKRRLRHKWKKMLMLVERSAREAREEMNEHDEEE